MKDLTSFYRNLCCLYPARDLVCIVSYTKTTGLP